MAGELIVKLYHYQRMSLKIGSICLYTEKERSQVQEIHFYPKGRSKNWSVKEILVILIFGPTLAGRGNMVDYLLIKNMTALFLKANCRSL